MSLTGKVAVITGSAKGLGKAFAASLLKNGAKVCLSDADSSLGQATCQEFKEKFGNTNASFTKCDVKNHQEFKDLFDKVHQEHKGIDIMVNNAGIANEAAIEDMIDINLRGVIYGTQFALDTMRRDKGGKGGLIVNVSSIAGFLRVPFVPVYAATKHGVVSYTQSLAVCLNGVNENNGKETLAEFVKLYGHDNVIYVKCDVKNDKEMKDLFKTTVETFKKLDIVVNNAGVVDEIDWKTCTETILGGVIRGTDLAMQYMRTDKGGNGGTIINVASISACVPFPFLPCYTGLKCGVVGYTRAWSEHPDTGNNGIRLLCLCPGQVPTDMVLKADTSRLQFFDNAFERMNRVFQFSSLEEVAKGFVKLLDDNDNHGGVLKVITLKDQETTYEYVKYDDGLRV